MFCCDFTTLITIITVFVSGFVLEVLLIMTYQIIHGYKRRIDISSRYITELGHSRLLYHNSGHLPNAFLSEVVWPSIMNYEENSFLRPSSKRRVDDSNICSIDTFFRRRSSMAFFDMCRYSLGINKLKEKIHCTRLYLCIHCGCKQICWMCIWFYIYQLHGYSVRTMDSEIYRKFSNPIYTLNNG